MITIKLPYNCIEPEFYTFLKGIRIKQSTVIRKAYNLFNSGEVQSNIQKSEYIKNTNLGSWFIQSAILNGKYVYERNKSNKDSKVIFGGRFNFYQRLKDKITKEEFRNLRLSKLITQGETTNYGNRYFSLDIVNSNQIIFKPNRNIKYYLALPKLNKNYFNKLKQLELSSKLKECPYQIQLDDKFIYISFTEIPHSNIILNRKKYIGIDLNPDNIGISIFNDKTLVDSKLFNLSEIINEIFECKQASNHSKTKHLKNKLNSEIVQISKKISELALYHKCNFVFIEDLKFKTGDAGKGTKFNRLTKNIWNRELFIVNLKKRIELIGGKVFEVNPAYTSIIGNLKYEFVDAVNASIEIARRGYDVIILKNKQFYPEYVNNKKYVKDQWKEYFTRFKTWIELCIFIKNSKMKYRVSLNESKFQKSVFSLNHNISSKVGVYTFDNSF